MTPFTLRRPVGLVLALAVAFCGSAQGKRDAQTDFDILVRFRDSIQNWEEVKAAGHLQGWDNETVAYLWTGVVLDFNLRVREITLNCFDFMVCTPANIQAEAPVFAELARLEHLELLSLGGNNIIGQLPDSWAAPGGFPALQSLSLSGSGLRGTLPHTWGAPGAFPALTSLVLDRNWLGGSLPMQWGAKDAFPSLETLTLDKNSFTGTLPESWGRGPAFSRLQTLGLADNRLSSSLPPGWGADGGFPALQTLGLAECRVQGGLPPEWAGRFSQLNKMDLSDNRLSGTLPPAWGCQGCFPGLQKLLLPNNSLSGSLPASWGALPALRDLHLSANRLTGELPGSWGAQGSFPRLVSLHVANNRLTGNLPSAWGDPLGLPTLVDLDASYNSLSGSLPERWGQPSSFSSMRSLYLHHNNLTGPLPASWQLNITMSGLFSLSLAHNHLSGTLPDTWGATDNSLTSLTYLDLGFNSLTGALPPSWGTSQSALSSLSVLVLAGNKLGGEVPTSWGRLGNLHYLVLAPGNPTVCRPLPYVGRFVTCYGDQGTDCQEPVQLRANCSSNEPGWLPISQPRQSRPPLSGLHIALVATAATLVAVCTMLGAVLALRWWHMRRWQVLEAQEAELALHNDSKPLADVLAAAAARKRSGRRAQHSALATKLLEECAIEPFRLMFCRGPDGNLVQLGAGAYGQVYKAFLRDVQPVAVKVFQTQDDLPADDFWREVSILHTCHHENIVRFLGACVDGDTTMMVTELLDTDLYRALQSNRVNWYQHGLSIALDVAQGLRFLHSRNIIHFDCKSPNILLSPDNSAKLADVGWAQMLNHMSYITGDGGTFNWAAPEQLVGLKCTAKADVYSYGLVLWELCTREVPVRGRIRDIRVPQEAPQWVVDLVRCCLHVDPASRPSMEEIVRKLMAENERLTAAATSGTSAGPSNDPAPSHVACAPTASDSGMSSLDERGLNALPGTSLQSRSAGGSGSAFDAGTSSGSGVSNHSRGRGGSGSQWAGHSSASTPQPPSNAALPSTLIQDPCTTSAIASQLDGRQSVPGASSSSHANPDSGSGDGSGGLFANSPWFAGTSGAGSGGTDGSSNNASGSGGGGDGSGGVFAKSPWFTGASVAASNATTSGNGASGGIDGSNSVGNGSSGVFAASPWLAGASLAPSHATTSGNGGSGGIDGINSGVDGSGGLFLNSLWFAGASLAASHATTSGDEGSGSIGGSNSGGDGSGGLFLNSTWFAGASLAASHATTSGDEGSGGIGGSNSGGDGSGGRCSSSPWFAGASLAASSAGRGASARSDSCSGSNGNGDVLPSIFDGSAWAAGRPAHALAALQTVAGGNSHVAASHGPMPFSPAGPLTAMAATQSQPAALVAEPTGGSVFPESPWLNENTPSPATNTIMSLNHGVGDTPLDDNSPADAHV